MASFQRRRNGDGSASVVAWVRIKPFKPVSKAFPKLSDARAWADALERELRQKRDRGAVRQDLPTLTLRGLVDEYLADPETKRLRYFEGLKTLLDWWVSHYGPERVLQFNVLKLREARERLSNGRQPATVNRYLSGMRSAWNWGRSSGLIPQDLVWPSRLMLTEPKGRTRHLSDGELEKLLEVAHKHSALMHAAIVVSVAAGVRQSELLRLRWPDIDFERQRLTVLLSKNGQSRTVHLPSAAADALKVLKRAGVVGAREVFVTESGEPLDKDALAYRWVAVRAAAGLGDFRWHDLRHSCASFLAQQGATLLEIGSVLGHKSPSVTQRYAHLVAGAPVTGHAALDSMLLKGRT